MPVELVNFRAKREGPVSVKLNWETLSELNNDYFKLEQSDDGSNWSSIGKIKGKGNSSILSAYNFTDENGSPYTTYYRLKQVDFNGDFSYSDIIAVPPAKINYSIVYPNPSQGTINIRSEKEIKQIVMYNAYGEQINLIEFDCDENEKFFEIDMSPYAKGNYLFHIYSCSDFREIIKVTLL